MENNEVMRKLLDSMDSNEQLNEMGQIGQLAELSHGTMTSYLNKARRSEGGYKTYGSKPSASDTKRDTGARTAIKKLSKPDLDESKSDVSDEVKAAVFDKIMHAIEKSGKSNEELMKAVDFCRGCIDEWMKEAEKQFGECSMNESVAVKDHERSLDLRDNIAKLKRAIQRHEDKLAGMRNTHPEHFDLSKKTNQLKNRLAKAIEAHKAIEPSAYSECSMNEAPRQSMGGALRNELSKAEPGSKIAKQIKHHNSMVRQFGRGTMDKAPSGYRFDNKGLIRLGVNEKTELGEKAVSKKQQRFMGMVHAAQKGEEPASKEVADVASSMKKSDAKDFASTKHKGLPEKVKEGSKGDIPAPTVPDLPMLGDKGTMKSNYGTGVYESLLKGYRNELLPKKQLNESVTITIDDGEEGDNELNQLLSMAGMKPYADSIEVIDEPLEEDQPDVQEPNWPTQPETMQDTDTLSTYSGGLNKPKVTGQSTVPILASQKDRQHTNEHLELERSLFKLYQEIKGE